MKYLSIFCGVAVSCASGAYAEEDRPPLVTGSIVELADFWANTHGGLRTGATVLNKLQISATFDGDAIGHPGLKLHGQVFAVGGRPLTDYTGDIQTVSNI